MKNVPVQVHTKWHREPQKISQKRGCMSGVSLAEEVGPRQARRGLSRQQVQGDIQGQVRRNRAPRCAPCTRGAQAAGQNSGASGTLVMKDTYTKARGPQTAQGAELF